ncbi:MAG: SDR family oxidoreductase [Bacteroidota bacterium]
MERKVVLITGGSSGIGQATGKYLSSKGYRVYGTTRNLDKHKDFKHFELLELDVQRQGSIDRTVEYIITKEGRLDVLVNNAGVGITGPLEETPIEEITKAFDINFNGPIRMIKSVLPQMRSQNSGLIINITSIAGYMGLPFRGVYSSTKAALEIATEALRMEVKVFGVEIATIAPGDFATNIAAGRYHVPVVEDSPYQNTYPKALALMNKDVDAGEEPIVVAKKVFHLIQLRKPGIRYPVGAFLQKLSIFLKKILPGKYYERLLMNHYKL